MARNEERLEWVVVDETTMPTKTAEAYNRAVSAMDEAAKHVLAYEDLARRDLAKAGKIPSGRKAVFSWKLNKTGPNRAKVGFPLATSGERFSFS